jgi:peptidylprolyl isomerase
VQLSSRRVIALFVLPIILLTACGSSGSKSSSAATQTTAPTKVTTKVGVEVTGGFGVKPTLTIPTTAAPATLTQQVITQGAGAVVAKGDTIAANYLGQTWVPKDGKPNVFDSSFDRTAAASFVIGVGSVITGWDKTLVGQKVGSRVLLSIPPADGYGSSGQSSAKISGTDTLVFVVDLVATYKPDASAPGTVVSNLPSSGLPKITNVPAKPPVITSTAGVTAPAKPTSVLVVSGTGAKIDSTKMLVLQLVQADLKTGKNAQSTWGSAPQVVAASSVLAVADALAGQNLGSRAVVLVPAVAAKAATATAAATTATPAEILIVDVVGQY